MRIIYINGFITIHSRYDLVLSLTRLGPQHCQVSHSVKLLGDRCSKLGVVKSVYQWNCMNFDSQMSFSHTCSNWFGAYVLHLWVLPLFPVSVSCELMCCSRFWSTGGPGIKASDGDILTGWSATHRAAWENGQRLRSECAFTKYANLHLEH